MHTGFPFRRVFAWLCVQCLTAAAFLVGSFAVNSSRAQADVNALIDQARNQFKPISQEQVAAARSKLKDRMRDVESYVGPSSSNGKAWLRYLHWEDLKKAVADEHATSLEPLDATLRKLNRDQAGLEKRQFRRLADALQRYRDAYAVSMWQQPGDLYNKQLDALNKALEAYHKEPTPANEYALSRQVRIINSVGQAPELVKALRQELVRPNAYVDISTALVAASAEPINRNEPITDCILGTNIHGDAHTTGHVEVSSQPSDNKAVLDFTSVGHTWSRNTGFNGPAVIRSTADTDFTANKRVELNDEAFVTTSARADARTDTHIHSVAKQGGGLGSRLVSNIGWRRAHQSERQAESIAANHAEGRVERRFNEELNDKISQARQNYEDEYRRPLERRGELPKHIRFSSTKNSIQVEVAQAGGSQIAAAGDPPKSSSAHDMTMRLHESAVNNYTATLLGGATARQTKPDEDVKFDVTLPSWMKRVWERRKTEASPQAKDEPFKEYALTLRDGRPISVEFAGGTVKLTMHISELKSGDKTFTNWDVTGDYKPEVADGKVTLRREKDLTMLPSDFRGQLNSRQVAERRNLEEELNKRSAQGRGFPKSIEFEPMKSKSALASAGPLNYDEFAPDNGWLVIGLDRKKKGG
jgi:hypothetical protein